MICIGSIKLPLYICPYEIYSTRLQGFHVYSSDPVLVSGGASQTGSDVQITYLQPEDYGYSYALSSPIVQGSPSSTFWTVINKIAYSYVAQSQVNPTPAIYNFYSTPTIFTGGLEGFSFNMLFTEYATQSVELNANYYRGYNVNYSGSIFPLPGYLYPTPGNPDVGTILGFNGYVGIGEMCSVYGVNLGPNGYQFLFPFDGSISTPNLYIANRQGATFTGYNSGVGYLSFAQPQSWDGANVDDTGIQIAPFPLHISDNATLDAAFQQCNANGENYLQNAQNFQVITLGGVSKYSGMGAYAGIIFPDKGYYIDIVFEPRSTQAANVLANPDGWSLKYDQGGWFMFKSAHDPVQGAIYNTQGLSIDFNYPPLPMNAINPLPCFNNAIEGVILS